LLSFVKSAAILFENSILNLDLKILNLVLPGKRYDHLKKQKVGILRYFPVTLKDILKKSIEPSNKIISGLNSFKIETALS